MRHATILSIGLVLTAIGCGPPSQQNGGDDLGGASDLARRDQATPSDFGTDGSAPDLATLDAARDLGPQGDLLTCDGNCTTQTCNSGQVLANGQCVPMQTLVECTAQHRQFFGVGLTGYCGDCLPFYKQYFGFCAQPMCGGDGSLGALCKALGRGCDATTLQCQPCAGGATLDAATGACVPTSCQARTDCPEIAGYYCTQLTATDSPQCRKRPCPAGQIWDRLAQACAACALCNGGEWPVTDAGGTCYCTASPGWFYDHSTSTTALEQCDEDGDGWLKESVKEELAHATDNHAQLDYTVLLNVQCAIPYFTSVELRNEWGQSLPLQLSDIGQPASVSGVAMYEDPANDTAGYVSATLDGSNSISGSSVNSLTKACYSSSLDLNQNGVDDYIEDQATSSPTLKSWAADYRSLTFFMELYHAHFEQASSSATVKLCSSCATLPLPGIAGTLVIEEPSRCVGTFPMQLGSSNGTYWQDCVRHRDNNYVSSNPLAYDFAQYECPGTAQGACPTPRPPVGIQPPDGSTPPHGACNGGIPTQWMGMTQYSQFMCGQINDSSTQDNNDVKSADVRSATQPNAKWEALSCSVTGELPTVGGPGTTANFLCTELPNGWTRPVTWLTRLYSNYSTPAAYAGGCIDEATEYPQLCPADPADAVAAGYGQIACGPPCPPAEKMVDSAGTFVMCLHPTLASLPEGTLSSDGIDSTGTAWSLTGEVTPGGSFGLVTNCEPDGGVVPDGGNSNCWTLE